MVRHSLAAACLVMISGCVLEPLPEYRVTQQPIKENSDTPFGSVIISEPFVRGQLVQPPRGWTMFCDKNPSDPNCQVSP